jgi:hypothetical protein
MGADARIVPTSAKTMQAVAVRSKVRHPPDYALERELGDSWQRAHAER